MGSSPQRRGCEFPSCEKPHSAKGLCKQHAAQRRRGVELAPILGSGHDPMLRFARFVGPPSAGGCVEWTGSRNCQGYGYFSAGGRRVKAHRWRYEREHGPLSADEVVMHSCDNPSCVAIEHLSSGTHFDNTIDAMDKGRHSYPPRGRPKLTEAEAARIYSLSTGGVMSNKEIASAYGVSDGTVRSIASGRSWKRLHREVTL